VRADISARFFLMRLQLRGVGWHHPKHLFTRVINAELRAAIPLQIDRLAGQGAEAVL
jgi:hypothetical protein